MEKSVWGRRLPLVALFLGGAAWGQIPIPGFQKSRLDQQREAAQRLAPAALQLRPPTEPAPLSGSRRLRLRVYVAQDYRDGTVSWQSRFHRLLDRVNQHLAAWPGVELEVVEFRPWAVQSQDRSLQQLLFEMKALDAGNDVDLVIGLVGAIPKVPESIHDLGMALELGRHFVMRSLHDLVEHQLVREHFDEMSQSERERLLTARKAHKELVLFLHELGHLLGAVHAPRATLLMNPIYSESQARFDDGNARLIEAALRHRIGGGPPDAMRAELRRLIEAAPDPDWDPRARESVSRALAAPVEGTFTIDEQRRIDDALAHHRAQRWEQAAERIDPLVARYPSDARLQRLGCELSYRGAKHRRLDPVCRRAASLQPEDPEPLLFLAAGQLDQHRDDEAELTLADAQDRLERGQPDGDAWKNLAALWQRAGAPTLAAGAAEHADEQSRSDAEKWAASVRRTLALPQPSASAAIGIPPRREGAYLRALALARAAIAERRRAAATQLLTQLARDFPKSPGVLLCRCESALQDRRLAAARRECERLVRMQAESLPGRLALAQLDAARGDLRGAAQHLRRIVATEPGLEAAWIRLAEIYGRSGATRQLAALRTQYQAQFQRPLR